MAGLGGAPAQQIQAGIAPQPLVTGAPPLSPTLLNAFRDGFITADDIFERISATTKAKKKAELQMATEATSPESIEARKQVVAAQAAQAQLAQQQAAASGPLVAPQAALSAAEIAAKQQLLPAQTELTAQQLEMNSKFMFPKALYDIATERLKVVNPVKRVDPANGAEYTQMLNAAGEDVTPGSPAHATYSRIAQGAFSNLSPGGSPQVAPKATVAPAAPVVAPAAAPSAMVTPNVAAPVTVSPLAGNQTRAALMEHPAFSGVPGSTIAAMSDADAADALVKANRSVPPSPSVIQPKAPSMAYTPGVGLQTGMRSIKDRALVPAEGVEKLALASQAKSTADRLQKAYADLIQSDPQFTGLINGTITKAVAGKRWNEKVAAFEREATAILAPVAKGTYNETGVLSDKDVERYKNVLPDLRDTPRVGNEKMQRLINEVNSAYSNKIEMWKKAGYDVGNLGADSSAATAPTPSVTPVAGKLVTIPGLGTGTYDPATGLFTRTQ